MSNTNTFYTKRMKVADLIANDGTLLSILQRLEIRLGFGEMTVAELCARYGISAELFLIICNIYSFSDYRPQIKNLDGNDISSITTYLRASHRYYTGVCFPAIHDNVHRLVKELDETSRRLIDKFYDDYDNEVSNHFKYEEEVVFPYIEQLLSNCNCGGQEYNIAYFEHNHSNINEKLNDLSNIITKYISEEYSSQLRYEILNEIHYIGNDLAKHSRIEDKLLVPLVEKFEARHGKGE